MSCPEDLEPYIPSAQHAALLLALVAMPFSGCGQELPREVFAVEGVLTVNGVPAANASLAFHSLDRGAEARCPVGRTDARGRFQLTTHADRDGAPAGDYAVTIIWPDESRSLDECNCPNPLQHDRLRGFYADADQTEIHATVRRSANSFRFDAWRSRGDDPIP